MSQDADLVERLQNNDLEALGELYDRYRLTIFRTALAIARDDAAAEDLLQEAFLRLHAHAHKLDRARPVLPWLYRVTVNLSYTYVTRRRRWLAPLDEFLDDLVAPVRQRPEPMAEERDTLRTMQHAINTLSFSHRVVIVLHYLNELSVQEIAEILNCPAGTVKSRLHYGREHLRHLLGETSPAAEVQYEFT